MSKVVERAETLEILFKTGIRTDGEIVALNLIQFEQEIRLSKEQSIVLAKLILSKFDIKEI